MAYWGENVTAFALTLVSAASAAGLGKIVYTTTTGVNLNNGAAVFADNGSATIGDSASTSTTMLHKFWCPVQNSISTAYATAGNPFIAFGSNAATGYPAILGNNSIANCGLGIIAATKDDNTQGDMLFIVRENDGTAFGTLTPNKAFRFLSHTTEILSATRDGSWLAPALVTSPISVALSATAYANLITATGGYGGSVSTSDGIVLGSNAYATAYGSDLWVARTTAGGSTVRATALRLGFTSSTLAFELRQTAGEASATPGAFASYFGTLLGSCTTAGAWKIGPDDTNNENYLYGNLRMANTNVTANTRRLFLMKGNNTSTTRTSEDNGGCAFAMWNTATGAGTFNSIVSWDGAGSPVAQISFVAGADAADQGSIEFYTRSGGAAVVLAGSIAIDSAWTVGASAADTTHYVQATHSATNKPVLVVRDSDGSVVSGQVILRCQWAGDSTIDDGAIFADFYDFETECGKIYVSGGSSAAVTYGTSSDMRLKTEIGPIATPLQKIRDSANAATRFFWNKSGYECEGFFAQRLYEVCPDAVFKPPTEDGKWMVDYGRVTPLLWAGMVELIAENSALRSRIKQLEERIAA